MLCLDQNPVFWLFDYIAGPCFEMFMTGNRTGAGHSVSIPIGLYSHRKAIDQDMTGAVCFTVCFVFNWKTPVPSHHASRKRYRKSPLVLSRLFESKRSLFWQTRRQEISINEFISSKCTWLIRPVSLTSRMWLKCRLSGDRQIFLQPQVGASTYELILFRLIIIKSSTWIFALSCSGQREDSPEAAGRRCHYQECQQSFWLIINNICMTVGTVFVFQLAPCPAVIHCLLFSCT